MMNKCGANTTVRAKTDARESVHYKETKEFANTSNE